MPYLKVGMRIYIEAGIHTYFQFNRKIKKVVFSVRIHKLKIKFIR